MDTMMVPGHVSAEMPKRPRSPPTATRVIEVLAYPSVQLLDVTGPVQVFASANDFAAEAGATPPYKLRVVTQAGRSVTASAGVEVAAVALPPIGAPLDTLMIAGGQSVGSGSCGPGTGRLGSAASQGRAPRRICLYRRFPAGGLRCAGWKTGGDALVTLR
jgi:hypothetical protein